MGLFDDYEKEQQVPPQSPVPAPAPKVEKPQTPDMPDTWLGRIADIWSGKSRTEFPDVPELDIRHLGKLNDKGEWRLLPSMAGQFKVYMGQLFARDPNALADIVKGAFPNAEITKDKFGNPMVNYLGKTMYINKPGASEGDAFNVAGSVLATAPFSKAATVGKNVVTRALGAGVMGGAGSVAQDAATILLGGKPEHGLTVGDIASEAGKAAGVGTVLSPVAEAVPAVYGAVRGALGGSKATVTQQMVARGRDAAEKAGLDAANYTDTQLVELGRVAPDKVVQRAAELREQATGIPLTAGQRAGAPLAMRGEQELAAGENMAAKVMSDFRLRQDESVQAALRGKTSGQPETQIGSDIQQQVQQAAQQGKSDIRTAYEKLGPTAQDRGRRLLFQPQASGQAPTFVRDRLQAADVTLDDQLTPAAVKAMKVLEDATTEMNPVLGRRIPKVFNVEDMERTRRQIGKLYPSSTNPTDQRAADAVKRAYDEWIDDAVDRGLIWGDQTAIDQLKQARQVRAEYAKKFEPQQIDGTVGNLVQKWVKEDLTGQQVFNHVFGAGEVAGARNTVQIVDRLAKIGGGEDSAIMGSLRDAARQRVIYGGNPTTDPTPGVAAKRIREAFSGKGEDVTARLLGKEKQEFLQLADQLDALAVGRNPNVGDGNPSKSGVVIKAFLNRAGGGGAGAYAGAKIAGMLGLPPEAGAAVGAQAGLKGVDFMRYLNAKQATAPGTAGGPSVRPGVLAGASGPELPSLYDQLMGGR